MKKMMNQPERFTDEYLEGVLLAHANFLKETKSRRAVVRKNPVPDKVTIVTGGGSGHLPLFMGYIGDGLADGCAIGNVFASPSSTAIYQTAKAAESGAGVLFLFGNYGGDRMNFEMAAEDLEEEGIAVRQVWSIDDIASAPKDEMEKRRGVAGIHFLHKVAGAAAGNMLPLDEVARLTCRARDNTRSMGVALSSCVLPEVGVPSFEIGEDEMELGMGIHGEPGIKRGPVQAADKTACMMVEAIWEDLSLARGDKVALLVNGLGATPREELYIVYRKVSRMLQERQVSQSRVYIGEYSTSLDMAGLSISMIRLDDDLEKLILMPAYSPLIQMD